MKTFLAVALYTAMVAAFDLGGAVWHDFHAARAGKTSFAATVPATAALKTESVTHAVGTIPSDT